VLRELRVRRTDTGADGVYLWPRDGVAGACARVSGACGVRVTELRGRCSWVRRGGAWCEAKAEAIRRCAIAACFFVIHTPSHTTFYAPTDLAT
jgi:hypothetical protein